VETIEDKEFVTVSTVREIMDKIARGPYVTRESQKSIEDMMLTITDQAIDAGIRYSSIPNKNFVERVIDKRMDELRRENTSQLQQIAMRIVREKLAQVLAAEEL